MMVCREVGETIPAEARGLVAKSVIREAHEIYLAIDLIRLGARLQFLEAETSISRDRLIKLYKEIKGVSPPKGLMPFSTDWFMTWMSNIHSSMFYNVYRFMVTHGGCTRIAAIVKSYRLYLEQAQQQGVEPVLDFTRAWTLVRFFDSDMLQLSRCTRCTGLFVAHAHDAQNDYVCVLCRPPSRAGKTRKAGQAIQAGQAGKVAPGPSPSSGTSTAKKHASSSIAQLIPPSISPSQWLAKVMNGPRV